MARTSTERQPPPATPRIPPVQPLAAVERGQVDGPLRRVLAGDGRYEPLGSEHELRLGLVARARGVGGEFERHRAHHRHASSRPTRCGARARAAAAARAGASRSRSRRSARARARGSTPRCRRWSGRTRRPAGGPPARWPCRRKSAAERAELEPAHDELLEARVVGVAARVAADVGRPQRDARQARLLARAHLQAQLVEARRRRRPTRAPRRGAPCRATRCG